MKIEIGDIVHVDINTAQLTLGTNLKVLYVPCSEGDCWHFLDESAHKLIITNERLTITKSTG